MGLYINPPKGNKEEFLERCGKEISMNESREIEFSRDPILVILLDNGTFTAAAVCHIKSEKEVFTDPSLPSSRNAYLVPREHITIEKAGLNLPSIP